jgi:hypothetical protein
MLEYWLETELVRLLWETEEPVMVRRPEEVL